MTGGQRPFLFSGSPGAAELLQSGLRSLGFEPVAGVDADASEIAEPKETTYRCSGRPHPLVIQWHQQWWPDGDEAYDARVDVVEAGIVIASIDIDALLRAKHSRPLREVIVERLVAVARQLSQG